jgi:hypothetical protein
MNALKQQIIDVDKLHDFKAYLEHSLRDPFTMNLKDCTLMEVIRACIKAKSSLHPNYRESLGGLIHNLQILEEHYHITLQTVQITDVFWGYFIAFCEQRGLKLSTIETMCNQLRSVLKKVGYFFAKPFP